MKGRAAEKPRRKATAVQGDAEEVAIIMVMTIR
jgi:hypothetical protein